MSPARSAQFFLCHWKIEKTDGWSDVGQYPLIINSVLCCCGATGWLETDLWVSQLTSVGSFLSLCLFCLLFLTPFITYITHVCFLSSADTYFSPLLSLRLSLLTLSSSTHPVFSHSLAQRCMSGIIMDHANAHETTRLESHCCRAHGECALLVSLRWNRHSCDAALCLDVALSRRKEKN